MQHWPRIAIIWIICAISLSACSTATSQPEAAPAVSAPPPPTATPVPIAEPTMAPDSFVAGVDVGGMTYSAAAEALRSTLAPAERPLEISIDDHTWIVRPADINLEIPVDAMLAAAETQAERGEPVRTPLDIRFDEPALRAQLDSFAQEIATSPTTAIITSTDVFSRSFAYMPGRAIDIDDAIERIGERLRSPQAARRITLKWRENGAPAAPDFAQIQAQVEAMAEEWDGVVGFYLYDLASGQTAALNENTVFSGASVVKVAIMLQTYANLETLDEDQEIWLRKMIVDSDNLAANKLLAASIGGRGTEDALVGVLAMSDMLAELGLEHTYQYMPYEAYDYLVEVQGYSINQGPKQEGEPPYTEADPVLRTTPAEMSRVFLLIDQCSQGEGELIAMYPDTLSADRCQEMLDWLAQNDDASRMCSGLPEDVLVEHKSGWIEDMQADVGIVRSPGGDFIVAIYMYQKTDWLKDAVAGPVIGSFARMTYTAYNPIQLNK